MRSAGLERHHERLPGRMHDGVGDLEAGLVDAIEDLHADADPGLRTCLAPGRLGGLDRRHETIDIGLRVGDAEAHAERRALASHLSDRCRLRQREALVRESVERGPAGLGRAVAVGLRTRRFRIRRPVLALRDRLDGAIEHGAMAFEERMRHEATLRFLRCVYSSTQQLRRRREKAIGRATRQRRQSNRHAQQLCAAIRYRSGRSRPSPRRSPDNSGRRGRSRARLRSPPGRS